MCVPYYLAGQQDTVRINEVIISGKKTGTVLSGFSVETVDTVIMGKFSLGTIAEAISFGTPVFVKNYGSGGSATASIRGTGASGTQVAWNGIRIDNPMLGQSDLSILSSGLTDRVNLYVGGASMIMNSGASGGIISLESEPEWEDRTRITLNPGFGSFGEYAARISAETGNYRFQSVTKAFYQSAENNFPFTDRVSRAESFRTVRENNEVRQKGFLQEIYNKVSDGEISLRLWYQDANRNLPSSLLTEYAGEIQRDESFRTMLHYENDRKFHFSAAWLSGRLDYRNRLAQIDSRNNSNTLIIKSGLKEQIGNIASIDVVVGNELNKVKSNNYDGRAARNTANAAVSVQNINSEKIRGSLLLRQILYENKLLLPDLSAGIMFKPVDGRDYTVRANVSRSSRIPSMNDLYWYPGGNPYLKNEYAWMSEVSFGMKEKFSSFSANYDISLFNNSIRDLIQWRPGEFSYWSASNIRNATTRGLESSASISYESGRLTAVLKACYSYTRAMNDDDESRSQLVYIPANMANGSLQILFGKFHSSWLTNYTGKRNTIAGSSKFLKAYTISSFSAGIQHITDWGMVDFSFDADNIFNSEYQNIAYYPLPGRSFSLRLLAQTTFRK